MREISIPDKHLNEVKALFTKMEDARKLKIKAEKKNELANLIFWDRISDIFPETEDERCKIDSKKWIVKIREEGDKTEHSIFDFLKSIKD